jgi:hypothetical protein
VSSHTKRTVQNESKSSFDRRGVSPNRQAILHGQHGPLLVLHLLQVGRPRLLHSLQSLWARGLRVGHARERDPLLPPRRHHDQVN